MQQHEFGTLRSLVHDRQQRFLAGAAQHRLARDTETGGAATRGPVPGLRVLTGGLLVRAGERIQGVSGRPARCA